MASVRGRRRRGGFTIMEVIVVIVLLGLAASLVLPRIVGGEDRKVQAGAEGVGELLSAVARRDAMLSQPLALTYDAQRERLVAQVLQKSRDGLRGEQSSWKEDWLLPEADVRGLKVVSVQADGAELDTGNLRVDFDQFSPRPALRVVLSDARERFFWSADLGASSLQAEVLAGDVRQLRLAGQGAGGQRMQIDLDDAGLADTAWEPER